MNNNQMKITSIELINDINSRFNKDVYQNTLNTFLEKKKKKEPDDSIYSISKDMYVEGIKDGLIIFSKYILEDRVEI